MNKEWFITQASVEALNGLRSNKEFHYYTSSSIALKAVEDAEALYKELVEKGHIIEDNQNRTND